MKRKKDPPNVNLVDWKAKDDQKKNQLVFEWLGHDTWRKDLYAAIRSQPDGVLRVPSRARHEDADQGKHAGAALTHEVILVANPVLVTQALTDGKSFSNAPYNRLGSGDFLLGLDPNGSDALDASRHDEQSKALRAAFDGVTEPDLSSLARWCSRAAVTTMLGVPRFDAALLAEQAALRFCQVLFGFARSDLPTLTDTLRTAYRAMTMQMLGRHFVTEPLALVNGRLAMGQLATRAGQLMQDYALGDPAWPEGREEPGDGLPGLTPVLQALATFQGALDGHERAVLVVGALAGTVGNIQAATCIVLEHLLADPARLSAARIAAFRCAGGDAIDLLWPDHIAPALALNPPAPYLPRRMISAVGPLPEGADIVLCVGSATVEGLPLAVADALVFGIDAGRQPGLHYCLGAHLARTMVSTVVGEVLRLDGLEEVLDDTDARPLGLQKRWGFACESYPLQYRRDRRVYQQPLNVMMRVRSPVDAHGKALRAIIRSGAPRIERLLHESRHVHFAWFEFLEDGHVLALHTVFDGDFEAYLQHFARQAGKLFDDLFEHLEQPPPRPVSDHPEAFVRAILSFHRGAAEGFFFSAYPKGDTPRVKLALGRLP